MRERPGGASARDGVLVVGSISADLTAFAGRLPAPGETILGDGFTLVLGGKGANQAIAASLAGAPARMVGCVGSDLFRGLVTDGLRDAGVDVSQVRRVPGPTGIAHIRVDESGENDIVVVPLANAALDEAQIDRAFAELAERSAVLLTQLEIPFAVTGHAIRRAHDAGMTVVLDPAPAHELDDAIWPLVDIVTPNETEAALLSGIRVADRGSAVEAGRWFLGKGAGAALITLAGAGAVLVDAGGVQDFPALPVDAVDTTAAGDAFAGYLAAGLAQGLARADAVRRASAAGALTVTKRGASPSLPASAEVDALLAAHG
ncbi:ribokinase [Agromyces archimandritae]|uniref:Ribokinase n=1 Tax=Agromyces archimandritae TaxID=2781962 RepID=A0A975FKG0_9MICO|nr:ribokinase [Agromyces archimandritae]QTX03506.1 ribokinase [Agromyces archimandritae]